MPKRKDEMCWVIRAFLLCQLYGSELIDMGSNPEWPEDSNVRTSDLFRSQVNELAHENARSLLFQFKDTDMEQVAKGLEAPVCEFVCRVYLAPPSVISVN